MIEIIVLIVFAFCWLAFLVEVAMKRLRRRYRQVSENKPVSNEEIFKWLDNTFYPSTKKPDCMFKADIYSESEKKKIGVFVRNVNLN